MYTILKMCTSSEEVCCPICDETKMIPIILCNDIKEVLDSSTIIEETTESTDKLEHDVKCLSNLLQNMRLEVSAYPVQRASNIFKLPCHKCKIIANLIHNQDISVLPPVWTKLSCGNITMV